MKKIKDKVGSNQELDHLGRDIRKLRSQQQRTLEEIANECGFTKSLLSKIETGKVIPPVATLVKIANALGTSMSALIESHNGDGAIYTPEDVVLKNIVKTEKGYHIYPFATHYKEKKMQPFLFVVRKGEVKKHSVSHEGEEFIYVIEGEIKFKVGGIKYTLKKGDGLYFNAINEHYVEPVTDEAKYLDMFI